MVVVTTYIRHSHDCISQLNLARFVPTCHPIILCRFTYNGLKDLLTAYHNITKYVIIPLLWSYVACLYLLGFVILQYYEVTCYYISCKDLSMYSIILTIYEEYKPVTRSYSVQFCYRSWPLEMNPGKVWETTNQLSLA